MEWTLVTRSEFPTLDRARLGQVDVVYVYMNERNERVLITLPRSVDTPENVRAELEKAAARAGGGDRQRFVID